MAVDLERTWYEGGLIPITPCPLHLFYLAVSVLYPYNKLVIKRKVPSWVW